MKASTIILSSMLSIFAVVACTMAWLYYNNNKELKTAQTIVQMQDKEIAQLKLDNTQLTADNIKYMKQANLKSFSTVKELERFLKADTVDSEYVNDYSSPACIELMRRAREQGYWMGIVPLNSTYENLLQAMVSDRKIGDVRWTTFCVAIVGDSDIYLVDPQNDEYTFAVMTMTGDFLEYTGKVRNIQ